MSVKQWFVMFTIPEFQAARKPPGLKLLRCPHCRQALNPLAAIVLPVAAGVVVGLRTESRAVRAAPKCPPCATALHRFVHLTRLTGNCCTCGRRLTELPPDEPTRPLPTVEEYKAAERRANR